MENNIRVLCTRAVDEALIAAAAAKNITIEVRPFIATGPIETVEVQQEIEHALLLSATVVFTSMNAVEAVAAFLPGEYPDWKIYCIGFTTRKLAEKYFGEASIAGFAEDAAALAELIAEENETEELLFFCGNKRRNELPDFLRSNDIIVNEVVVYETTELHHKITGSYNAVLFFSPSAAESFFVNNQPGSTTIFFAIGKTTAATIQRFSSNKIIIAGEPGKENMVNEVIEYFKG